MFLVAEEEGMEVGLGLGLGEGVREESGSWMVGLNRMGELDSLVRVDSLSFVPTDNEVLASETPMKAVGGGAGTGSER